MVGATKHARPAPCPPYAVLASRLAQIDTAEAHGPFELTGFLVATAQLPFTFSMGACAPARRPRARAARPALGPGSACHEARGASSASISPIHVPLHRHPLTPPASPRPTAAPPTCPSPAPSRVCRLVACGECTGALLARAARLGRPRSDSMRRHTARRRRARRSQAAARRRWRVGCGGAEPREPGRRC